MKRRIRPAISEYSASGGEVDPPHLRHPAGPRQGTENIAYQQAKIRFPPLFPQEEALVLADTQTSGGLLMFVPEDRADALRKALSDAVVPAWWIGRTHSMGSSGMPRITVV
jgi:selenophosphate synthase